MYAFLLQAGCTRVEVGRALTRLQHDANPRRTARGLLGRGTALLSGIRRLLQQWCRELPYVYAQTGTPRRLQLDDGEPCLRLLLARHFPDLSTQQALRCLEENGAILREADGSYSPVELWQTRSPEALKEAVTMEVCRHLEAAACKLQAPDSSPGDVDRSTTSVRLPLRLLHAFRQHSGTQLRYTIDGLDSWLLDQECRDPDEPCALVSVHAHVLVQPENEEKETVVKGRAHKRRAPARQPRAFLGRR